MMSPLRFFALAVAGSLILSCSNPTSLGAGLTGSLLVSVQHEGLAKSILPEAIGSVSYKATGSGPAGETLAPATSATGSFSFTSLSLGSWTVTVSGLDSAGGTVASGSATVTVGTGAAATAAVQLLPVAGTGTLQLSLSWPSGKQVDEVVGSITPDGGTATPITCTIKDNTATLTKDLAAGSYILIVNLKKSGSLVAAPRMEVAGIYKGKTSSGSIALVAADFEAYFVSYDGNSATGGTPPTDSSNYQSGDSATVAGNTGTLVKTAYSFAGWNTKADGTGTSYAVGDKITMGAGSVALWASWTAAKFGIKGNIQKGPFSSGTSITIQALDANLDPLGTSYQTSTTDDFGAFTLGSQITSRYVEIIAKGYYFNEIAGSLSPSELTLRAYTDLGPGTVANVNLLTTLEEKRVAYLLKNKALSFTAAKTQAEAELLAVFNIKNIANVAVFETMDISKVGESNAILLAISCILQRTNTVAQLSELISKISVDLESDGTLDSATTKAAIANYSSDFTVAKVTTNLSKRYSDLGLSSIAVPDFGPYLDDDNDSIINKFDFTLSYSPATTATESTAVTSNAGTVVLPPDIASGTATTTIGSLVVDGKDEGKTCTVANGSALAVKLTSPSLASYDGTDQIATITVTYSSFSVATSFRLTYSPTALTPTFSLSDGANASAQTVTIASATPGASIRYTTNGTAPTQTSGTLYSTAISVAADQSIKAIAYRTGWLDSVVGTTSYPAAAAVSFDPSGLDIYPSAQTVSISSATSGATIWYTTNGDTPTTASTKYTIPITVAVNPGTTIKAIAIAPQFFPSAVRNGSYFDSYRIGNNGPAGGIVFYDKGSYSDGWRYLEAAPSDQSTGIEWGNGSNFNIATAKAIGTGKTNTAAIIAAQGSGTYAATLCKNLSIGGFSDWFLPSKDELNLMLTNLVKAGLGGFEVRPGGGIRGVYVSSSQTDDTYDTYGAYVQDFRGGDGSFHYGNKMGDPYYVRACRAF
jgi:hypothetical protein